MHQLDGAHERVSRAGEHLVDLKDCIGIFCKLKKYVVASQHEPVLRELRKSKKWGSIDHWSIYDGDVLDPKISILTGEVIYNLRAALDYLIYELAQLDSKQIVKRTQFPIEDCGKTFVEKRICSVDNRRQRNGVHLRGLNDTHVALISRYQPCYGCYWTGILRDISDPDKHRELTLVKSSVKVLIGEAEHIDPINPVNVNSTSFVNVVFSDRMPVIETLQKLHLKVSETIDAFDSEFK